MLRNYIILAWRNILRSKVYSLINISGLSLGITCCLLLALYIQDEMGYDKHHTRLDDLYRIYTHFETDFGFGQPNITGISPPILPAVRAEVPEIEAAARYVGGRSQNLITYGDNVFYESDGVIADSSLFDVLTYEFIEGNPRRALVEANTVVITDRLAHKLFNKESALNKLIEINQQGLSVVFKVTGVIKDQKKTFDHINFATSMTSDGFAKELRSEYMMNQWAGENFFTGVVRLAPGVDIKTVEAKMDQVLIKYGSESLKALGFQKSLHLEPVKDVYLRSDIGQSARIKYIYVIASIATFILMLACINFMNLSTARAGKRAAEIGIRKVMGAFRSTLIRHILGEAMVIVLLAIAISMVLVQVCLPYFNYLTNKTISFDTGNAGYFALALLVLAVLTGLLAGSYPAFYLSSFQPAEVLKGKFTLSNASGLLRRSLVVFQFVIAITLVSGMIIISRQLNFMQHKNLGFDANAKIVLPLRTAEARDRYEGLRNELQKYEAVEMVSGARFAPGTRVFGDMIFYSEGGSMETGRTNFRNEVDQGYVELLGIPMLAGRTFTSNRPMESQNKIIVNRASAKQYGYEPEEMVGKNIYFDWENKKHTFEVIGVMEDYHHISVREEIKPLILVMPDTINEYEVMIASLRPGGNFEKAVAGVEKIWKAQVDNTPFEYSFLDENVQKQYDEDRRVSRIITAFTCMAVLISCLGLYGLSTYMAERRFKEIGVRKVMGASVQQIVTLMSSEFVKLVLVALALSVPLSWYLMDLWLQGFAYRVSIDVLIFVYAGGIALIIALVTVSFESLKAASANPLTALRAE
ncbi:ABC transporter permease [Dawidia soli]|uniref:ABC transporter permease n=1 Tax=Dawidia soli TaxID=2782352 RepID=A0AAP2GCX5_9BACT|nr:ABC transporter permease [Dawidia soli]MBT1686632.1 ABC transporter permease [Dawidia soli]